MKNTQFDLEQQILDCWRIVDDLDTIYTGVYEDSPIDNDKLAHMLLGLKELYSIKFEKCFNTFEEHIREKHYSVS